MGHPGPLSWRVRMPQLPVDRLPELLLELDDSFTVRWLNRPADALGWSGEALKGQRLLDVLPLLSSRALEEAARAGKVETYWRRRDATECAVDLRFARLGAGRLLASVREVPDR